MKMFSLIVAGGLAVTPMTAGANIVFDSFAIRSDVSSVGSDADDAPVGPEGIWTSRGHEITDVTVLDTVCVGSNDCALSYIGFGRWRIETAKDTSATANLTYSLGGVTSQHPAAGSNLNCP